MQASTDTKVKRKKQKYDHLIKLVLIGDGSVGKTSLILRFSENNFVENQLSTIGVDFKVKFIQSGSSKVKLQLWDTAGQDRFRTITASYYKGAQCVCLVYDCTSRDSFNSITKWIQQIDEHADEGVMKILICNKIDMAGQRMVSEQEAQELCEKYELEFYQCSAKSGEKVEHMFDEISSKVISKTLLEQERLSKEGRQSNTVSVELVPKQKKNKAWCWS